MIHLKANATGKTKKEYIEDVIDDCKLIFNAAFADQFFHDDNLKNCRGIKNGVFDLA